jgi:biotin transport system substrate-specific component
MQTMRRTATLADVIGGATLARDLVLVLGASLLTGLAAQLEIRLPFTPVPITLQPLAVFLFGAALGSRRAALAMSIYLAQGLHHIAGPTGGYLVGFVPSAFLIGWFAERGWDRNPWRAFLAMGAGSIALFACGLAQLSFFVAPDRVLALGLWPFLAGDLLKMAAAAAILPGAWKLLQRAGLAPRD